MSESVRVGVLSLHNSKETKAILNSVEALGHEGVWLRRENTVVDIRDGAAHLEPDVDTVLNRTLLSTTEHSCELLGLAQVVASLRPTCNRPANVLTALHKFATAAALTRAGVRVPDALLALDATRLNENRRAFGDELVYKTAIGTHGGGTWKVSADESINPRVGDRFAFLQSLIDIDPDVPNSDLRVYVVDGDIVAAMRRHAPKDDWRTNVALGGRVERVDDLPEEVERFAVDAATAVGLDYAGVDLVEGSDGWYVLEVNPTAGFKGLFEATGVSPAPHIAALGIEAAGSAVDPADVTALEGALDTSRPSGMPATASSKPDEPRIIGYTDEVLVSGTSGSERIVAKSDTGAVRTSIDTRLAARIGAGPIKSMTKVKSGSVRSGKSRPVVDIVIGIGGERHTVSASLEDRSHMTYPLLLGRDILQHYQVDVRRRHDDEDEVDAEE